MVSGGGTGSYYFESNSGVYNELQCGSYAFMDADYGRILDKDGNRIDQGEWENAFFILTSVMSHAKADKAICDAGLKAQSVDSGLPVIYGRDDVEYVKCSDEHGVISDPDGVLKVNDKLRLVPGHCDPTANVHDWYVGVRGTARWKPCGRSRRAASLLEGLTIREVPAPVPRGLQPAVKTARLSGRSTSAHGRTDLRETEMLIVPEREIADLMTARGRL